jgi:hypothetical protein
MPKIFYTTGSYITKIHKVSLAPTEERLLQDSLSFQSSSGVLENVDIVHVIITDIMLARS